MTFKSPHLLIIVSDKNMIEHKFVHIEIPAKDLPLAEEFYGKVFGWKVMTESASPEYVLFATGETGVGGGFRKSNKVSNGEVLLHIQTEDIPKTLKKIEAYGGHRVTEKIEIGNNMGYYAVFRDNSGNVLGIWSQK
jgi:predicted enzyme related to lactoylglutathione lyase